MSKTATIQTTTINIRVMKVGNKQLTLAVFKQLPRIHQLPDYYDLWGIVRYKIQDNEDSLELWLVVCIDEKLHRFALEPWSKSVGYRMSFEKDIYRARMALTCAESSLESAKKAMDSKPNSYEQDIKPEVLTEQKKKRYNDCLKERTDAYNELCRIIQLEKEEGVDFENSKLMEKEREAIHRHILASSEQLFIAV